ncbi:SDR family oxidoreductase [Celerinatantimonas yamalensis]|uniref:SDR family oxidoreductase n=1 Tax=Celerinatantimonas yamalensis TaxID=559956 RepID=A0ABW9G404_9GAMM
MQISQQCIVLTGATGGIGQALAMQLAQAGANLILVGRDMVRLEQLAASLPAGSHQCWCAELLEPHALQQFLARLNDYGQTHSINMVINNAGCQSLDLFCDHQSSDISRQLMLNVEVPMQIALAAQQWLTSPGMLVNIGSVLAAIGMPGYSVYGASKAAMYRFSEALAREWSGSGRQVLYVAPRATATTLNDARAQSMQQRLKQNVDSPEEVASIVLQAIKANRSVRWIGWPERLFVLLNQLRPSWVGRELVKQRSIIEPILRQEKK